MLRGWTTAIAAAIVVGTLATPVAAGSPADTLTTPQSHGPCFDVPDWFPVIGGYNECIDPFSSNCYFEYHDPEIHYHCE